MDDSYENQEWGDGGGRSEMGDVSIALQLMLVITNSVCTLGLFTV